MNNTYFNKDSMVWIPKEKKNSQDSPKLRIFCSNSEPPQFQRIFFATSNGDKL